MLNAKYLIVIGENELQNKKVNIKNLKTGEEKEISLNAQEIFENNDLRYLNKYLSIEFKEKLIECFPDFSDFIFDCQFADCAHIGEKGCGVAKAVKEGKIEGSRYESYVAIYNELKDLKSWQVTKKR